MNVEQVIAVNDTVWFSMENLDLVSLLEVKCVGSNLCTGALNGLLINVVVVSIKDGNGSVLLAIVIAVGGVLSDGELGFFVGPFGVKVGKGAIKAAELDR